MRSSHVRFWQVHEANAQRFAPSERALRRCIQSSSYSMSTRSTLIKDFPAGPDV